MGLDLEFTGAEATLEQDGRTYQEIAEEHTQSAVVRAKNRTLDVIELA